MTNCLNHDLSGMKLTEGQQGGLRVDPDDDGILEWTCESADPLKCIEVDRSGPTSDSFLLSDGTTRVERIDVGGDGDADLIKIGDDETREITRPVPLWQPFVESATIAAVVAGNVHPLEFQKEVE